MNDSIDEADGTAFEPEAERGRDGRFVKGVSGNPAGRPPGMRKRLAELVLRDVSAHWEANSSKVLQTLLDDYPRDYAKLVAALLPKTPEVEVNEDDELTEEQLMQRVATARQDLAAAGIDPFAAIAPTQAPEPTFRLPSLSKAG